MQPNQNQYDQPQEETMSYTFSMDQETLDRAKIVADDILRYHPKMPTKQLQHDLVLALIQQRPNDILNCSSKLMHGTVELYNMYTASQAKIEENSLLIQQLTKEGTELADTLDQQERLNKSLQREYEDLNARQDVCQTQLNSIQVKNGELIGENKRLFNESQNFIATQNELADLKQRFSELNVQNSELLTDYENIEIINRSYQKEVEQLKAQPHDLQIESERKDIREKSVSLEKEKAKFKRSQDDLKKRQIEVSNQEELNEKKKSDNAAWEASLTKREEELKGQASNYNFLGQKQDKRRQELDQKDAQLRQMQQNHHLAVKKFNEEQLQRQEAVQPQQPLPSLEAPLQIQEVVQPQQLQRVLSVPIQLQQLSLQSQSNSANQPVQDMQNQLQQLVVQSQPNSASQPMQDMHHQLQQQLDVHNQVLHQSQHVQNQQRSAFDLSSLRQSAALEDQEMLQPSQQTQNNLAQPGLMQPGLVQPSFAQPGSGQPSLVQAQPGSGQPSLVQPSFAQPGLGQSSFAQPRFAQLGNSQGLSGQRRNQSSASESAHDQGSWEPKDYEGDLRAFQEGIESGRLFELELYNQSRSFSVVAVIANIKKHIEIVWGDVENGENIVQQLNIVADRLLHSKCELCGAPGHIAKDCGIKKTMHANAGDDLKQYWVVVFESMLSEGKDAKQARIEHVKQVSKETKRKHKTSMLLAKNGRY